MDDAHEERFRQYDAWMSRFASMLQVQHETNQQQAETNREQAARNTRLDRLLEQQAEFNRDLKTTLAEIKALLARMIERSHNGTDA